MSAQRTIKSYVLHKYGLHISAETPEFDEKTKKWIAAIKSDYPVYLQDDRNPDTVQLHFIPIRHIGKISFDEKLSLIHEESTDREVCINNIQSLLKTYYDRTEKIIVQASADVFVQIPEFRHYFIPIDQIITALMEKEKVSIDNLLKHRSARSQCKFKQYLKLLESTHFIEREDDSIKTGRMYWFLHESYENKVEAKFHEEEFRKAIISELVRKKYSILTQVFEISRFKPSIHIDSCIYRPAIEAEKVMCLSNESISSFYKEAYGRINEYTLANHLRRLHSVGAIERQGDYWCGNQKLLDRMLDLKNELPELTPPFMS